MVIVFFILSISNSIAQKIVHGSVKNADTGEFLPMANMQVEGTYRGTITNDQGNYILELKKVPAVILVKYIGFISKRVRVTDTSPDRIDVLLKPTVIKLRTLIVTGEDPAVNIMRKVIRKKKEWRALLKTYKADAYTRLVLENDTGIVSISESTSKVYWHKEKGSKEIVKSKRETSNIRDNQMTALASYLPNLYDDDIEIMGFKIIGPTHPKALKYYNFKKIGDRQIDEKAVFDILVTPKSKLQPTFNGRISILEGDYVMIDLDLKPNESMLFPPPIQEFNLHFKQQFNNFGQAFWLPMDIRIDGGIKIGIIGFQIPVINYKQISRLTDYQINITLPDSLYRESRNVYMDSLSIRQDSSFTSKYYVIPLTEKEDKAYSSLDSTMTLEKAFKPTGLLAKLATVRVSTTEQEDRSSGDTPPKKGRSLFNLISHLQPQFRYNRVDEMHIGLKVKQDITRNLSVHAASAYKTGLERWSFETKLNFRWGGRRNRGTITGTYVSDTHSRYTSENYPHLLNSIQTLLGFEDYFDYFWNKKWNTTFSYRFQKLNTKFSLGFNIENHSSVSKTSDRDLLSRDYIQRSNPAVEDGNLNSMEFTVALGNEYVPWGTIGQQRAEFKIEHSSPDILNSDFSFTRYQLTLDVHINTFLRRRFMPNAIDLRVVGGTSTGSLPVQRMGTLDVRLGSFSPFGVFRSLNGIPPEGEHYVGVYWEHNFRTVPFELIGLRALAKQGLSLLIHGAHGRTWISDETRSRLLHDYRYFDKFHHEIGLSLNGILGFLRLDVTRRLDQPDIFIGVSLVRWY
jgi:hypothetical protein